MDAGPHIGVGHLQRCLSLAAALAERGEHSCFLVNDVDGNREFIEPSGFGVETLLKTESWTNEDVEETKWVARQHECSVAVVDSHEVSPGYLAALRSAGLLVVARDDQALFPFPCQMVLNGNADARRLPYSSSSGDTEFLLGPEYMILGREFWEVPPRPVRTVVQNILLTVGGGDQRNLMPEMLRRLDQVHGEFTVTAVIGPFFENVTEVKSAADSVQRTIRVVESPRSMRDLMEQADLAISAAGQTLYELARLGCPTIAIQVADNQAGQLQVLADLGCLCSAGGADGEDLTTGVERAVVSLLPDLEAHQDMAAAGQRLVDGQGAIRVAEAIIRQIRLSYIT